MKKIFVILTVFLFSALVPLMAQETGAVEQPALSEGALEASEVSESLSDEIIYDENEVSYNPEDDFYGHALHVSVDACASLLKFYAAESLSYKYGFRNGIGLSAGLRVMENIFRTSQEPYIYLIPYADFWYKHWYLGAGVLFDIPSNTDPLPVVHTGWNFGQWECGLGRIGIDFGLELSPTVYIVESTGEGSMGDALGEAFGSVFGTILNVIKINLGVSWLLPLR